MIFCSLNPKVLFIYPNILYNNVDRIIDHSLGCRSSVEFEVIIFNYTKHFNNALSYSFILDVQI